MTLQISDIRAQHDLNTRSTPRRYKYQISEHNTILTHVLRHDATNIRYQSTTRFKHTFYAMTLQISDIRAQHDLNTRSTP